MEVGHGKKIYLIACISVMIIPFLAGCVPGLPSDPPTKLLERNDHVAMATWYEEEASNLRARARDMQQMIKVYEETLHSPALVDRDAIRETVRHCRILVEGYSRLAQEADALARVHRDRQANQ